MNINDYFPTYFHDLYTLSLGITSMAELRPAEHVNKLWSNI